MKINIEKLKKLTGIPYTSKENLIFYMQGLLYFLKTHNKNYTNEQMREIETLYDILDCVECE